MNKFIKLSRDTRPQEQPQSSYSFGKNGIQNYVQGSVINEPGFLPSSAAIPYVPIGVIETDKFPIIFSTDNVHSAGGYYDYETDNYTPCFDDVSLPFKIGFNTNNFITGQAQRNYKGQIVAAFTDKVLPPFYLNFDEPVLNSLDDMLLFTKATAPKVDITVITGGTLLPGAYYVAVKYLRNDGTESSYLTVSSPIIIDGTQGTVSDKAIQIAATGVDSRWDKLQFAIITKVNGVTSAVQLMNTISTGGTTSHTYSGAELTEAITLEEILTIMKPYSKVGVIGQLNDALYLANVTSTPRVNLQKFVNQIRLKWYSKSVSYDYENLKSGKEKSFMHSEVYAFYIRFKLVDGTTTDCFHIPGPALTGEDRNYSGAADDKDIVARRYQVEDRIDSFDAVSKSGYFGKWENMNETYPNTDDYSPILMGAEDLRNTAVRHHRFPSIAWCKEHLYPGNSNYGKSELDMLGVAVENLTIPSQYSADIIGYELFYSKRNLNNSTVLGQSLLLFGARSYQSEAAPLPYNEKYFSTGGNWDSEVKWRDSEQKLAVLDTKIFHFHAFDTLFNKPSITPEYLSLNLELSNVPEYVFENAPAGKSELKLDYILNSRTPTVATHSIQKINQTTPPQYVPNNLNIGLWHNANIETFFGGTIDYPDSDLQPSPHTNKYKLFRHQYTDFSGVHKEFQVQARPSTEKTYLTNMMAIRTDMFLPFTGQSLVRLGSKDIADLGVIYNGDTYISDYTFHTYGNISAALGDGSDGDPIGINKDSGLRVARRFICETAANLNSRYEIAGDQYSKYYPKSALNIGDNNNYLLVYSRDKDPNSFGYTKDSNALDDLIVTSIYNTFSEDLNSHPYRIHRGGKLSRQTKFRSWRSFLPLDYYEMQKNMGVPINIEGMDDRLLIHCENALFLTQNKSKLESDIIAVTLGSGDIFQFEPQESLSAKLGYAGTQHQLACVRTPAGYVFIDSKQGQVFIYKGGIELINNMLNTFFKEFLRLKETNVFTGNGYTIGYDNKYKRLLLTAKNRRLSSGVVKELPEDLSTLTAGDIVYKDGVYQQFLGINDTEYNCVEGLTPTVGDFEFTISETSPKGYVIGTLTGTNVNDFFLNTAGLPFSVDPVTGILIVTGALDFYVTSDYTINGIATNNEGGSAGFTVTIHLTFVNQPPKAPNKRVTLNDFGVTDGQTVTHIEATDREGDTLYWYLIDGNGVGTFEVEEMTGEVYVITGASINAAVCSYYWMSIVVYDGTDYIIITLEVDVVHENIAPAVSDQEFSVLDNFLDTNPDRVVATLTAAVDVDVSPSNEDSPVDYTIESQYPAGKLELVTDSTNADFLKLKIASGVVLDPEVNPFYRLLINAIDKGFPPKTTQFIAKVNVLYNPDTLENIPYQYRCDDTVTVVDFDFLAVRYGWQAGAGTDLDTLTGFAGTPTGDSDVDDRFVGYAGSGNYDVKAIGTKYLQHGHDNTTTGGEMVLIDFLQLAADYGGLPTTVDVLLKAMWWGSIGAGAEGVLPGEMTFELIAWKGGAMVKGTNTTPSTPYDPMANATTTSTFDWSNPTADSIVYRQTFNKQILNLRSGGTNASGLTVTAGTSGNPTTYGSVGTLTFNKITQEVTLTY